MADDSKADAGILLVHGIGEQREGETLQSAVSTFYDWLETQALGTISLEWTCLKPSLGFSGEPANALISIDAGDSRQRLLFAESW